ncbi:RsmB/NOP family class I SAM-dependent RNA methyltransferase [soil metagenome]
MLDLAWGAVAPALDPRERAWTHELLYGTLRLRNRLDHRLAAFVRSGLPALEPDVLDVLRLGAYQLAEMDGVPAYAAVSQSVELAKSAGVRRAAGLVNGVLQALRRRGGEVDFPTWESDPAGYLSTWGSHPRWLVERWVEKWGTEVARAVVESDNRRAEVYLNPLGVPPDLAASRLVAAGIGATAIEDPTDSVRLERAGQVGEALAALPAVVQDPAAAAVATFAAAAPGERVVDLCAAPGGKALAMAAAGGSVVAADLSASRLGRVVENVARVGWSGRVFPLAADALSPPFRAVDLVLLDAPCTGTGTLRRHPDGRWRLQPADVEALAELQRSLLDAAAPIVRPGGRLVYATCSLEPEENEVQVARFLADHPEFELDPCFGCAAAAEAGVLRLLPPDTGADGAFAARLRRCG